MGAMLRRFETVLRPAVPVLLLILLAVLGIEVVSWRGGRIADEWMKPLLRPTAKQEGQIVAASPINASTKLRMAHQLEEVRNRRVHHLLVMRRFYVNYYMTVTVAALMGIVSAIILVYISNKGIGETDARVRTAFLTASILTAFFLAMPNIYRQQENIADNKALALSYAALENEIASFFAANQSVDGKIRQSKQFLRYVDSRMALLGNVAIGFDYTKIPQNYSTTVPDPAATGAAPTPAKQ